MYSKGVHPSLWAPVSTESPQLSVSSSPEKQGEKNTHDMITGMQKNFKGYHSTPNLLSIIFVPKQPPVTERSIVYCRIVYGLMKTVKVQPHTWYYRYKTPLQHLKLPVITVKYGTAVCPLGLSSSRYPLEFTRNIWSPTVVRAR